MKTYSCLGIISEMRFKHETKTFIIVRDVKTVYFSEPVTGLPKPVFYRLPVTERPIVSRIIVTGRSALAVSLSVDHLLLHGGRGWSTYQTHGRRRGAKDSGVSKR